MKQVKQIKKLTADEAKKLLRGYWFATVDEQEQVRHYARVRMHSEYTGYDDEF
jgi:hypothetical protein